MKKLIATFIFIQAAVVQVNAGQPHDLLIVAQKAVQDIELAEELGMANVAILDAFMDQSGKAYVTSEVSFADKSGLKLVSCWEVEFSEKNLIQFLTRLRDKACR